MAWPHLIEFAASARLPPARLEPRRVAEFRRGASNLRNKHGLRVNSRSSRRFFAQMLIDEARGDYQRIAPDFAHPPPWKVVSLFSGCLGLELGLRPHGP